MVVHVHYCVVHHVYVCMYLKSSGLKSCLFIFVFIYMTDFRLFLISFLSFFHIATT